MGKYQVVFSKPMGSLDPMIGYLKGKDYEADIVMEEDRLSGILTTDRPLDEATHLFILRAPLTKSVVRLE